MNQEYETIIQSFSDKLPHFTDGRIDYTDVKEAPVINCFIKHNDQILILRRSEKVSNYNGKWNSVAGFLDSPERSLEDIVRQELKEELNIDVENIADIKFGENYTLPDKSIGKTWIIFPVLVEIKDRSKIKLDWEHKEFCWILPSELKNYDIVPGLEKVLHVFGLI